LDASSTGAGAAAMIRTGTLEHGLPGRKKFTLANGTGYFKTELIGSDFDQAIAPQVFLVEQDPNTVILPHFHVQNEFQVVVQGSGTIGRHDVRPVGVHYAGAHTGYGPITAGAGGLWYFTLRPAMDPGAKFLPEARAQMQRVAKRHLLGPLLPISEDCARRRDVVLDQVFAPQADGIAGWLMRLPAHAAAVAPTHAGGLARMYLVAAGRARMGGALLPRWSVVFATAEEEPIGVQAGAEGAEVLVLQFPQ